MAKDKSDLKVDLERISKLDLKAAKHQLEGLVTTGVYEGWLFQKPDDIDSLMVHLIVGLIERSKGEVHSGVTWKRSVAQAQEGLVDMALWFFKVNPNKAFANEWLIEASKLPYFKKRWERHVWQVKRPNAKKLEFVLECLAHFDKLLCSLLDKLQEFVKSRRKWRYFKLSRIEGELSEIAHSQPQLASALGAVLKRVYPQIGKHVLVFDRYLSTSLQEFTTIIMPFLEARWRRLSTSQRRMICGTTAKGEQGWGKVDDHMKNAVRAVVYCSLACDQSIDGLTLDDLKSWLRA